MSRLSQMHRSPLTLGKAFGSPLKTAGKRMKYFDALRKAADDAIQRLDERET